jgi:hypothetical protein
MILGQVFLYFEETNYAIRAVFGIDGLAFSKPRI